MKKCIKMILIEDFLSCARVRIKHNIYGHKNMILFYFVFSFRLKKRYSYNFFSIFSLWIITGSKTMAHRCDRCRSCCRLRFPSIAVSTLSVCCTHTNKILAFPVLSDPTTYVIRIWFKTQTTREHSSSESNVKLTYTIRTIDSTNSILRNNGWKKEKKNEKRNEFKRKTPWNV